MRECSPKLGYEIIYFMKSKLTPIDTFLPFFYRGKKLGMFKRASIFVFQSDFKKSVIEPSSFYQKMLEDLEIDCFDFGMSQKKNSGKKKYLNQIIFILRILILIIKPSKYRKVVFGLPNVSGTPLKILNFLIKRTGTISCSFKVAPITNSLSDKIAKSNGLAESELWVDTVDVDLTLSSENFLHSLPDDKQGSLRYVGYGRGCPDWWDAVKQYSLEKACSKLPVEPFIYWPLSVLHRVNNGLELHFGDATLDLLSGLAKTPNQPLIVFRYHPTTDKKHFAKIIDKSGYKNFIVSNEHSNVLIERCKLVISTIGSTVFVDANYRSKPCLLYVSPETLKGKAAGVFNELIFDEFAQFVVIDDLARARELSLASCNELTASFEKRFVDFKHDTISDKQFLSLFDR